MFVGKSYSEIDCSHLVHKAFADSGKVYPYTATQNWPPKEFEKVDSPTAGDVILFDGHIGIYVAPGKFFGSQTSTGPKEATFGDKDPYWGTVKKVRGYYRWRK